MKQSQKALADMEPRLIKFADLLATGTINYTQAAIKAGYTPKTANAHAYKFLGNTRESSFYPNLWDYFNQKRIANLRKYEVKQESVLNEMALIAFSDISKFVEFPRFEYEQKRIAAINMEVALEAVTAYNHHNFMQTQREKSGRKKPGVKPMRDTKPRTPTEDEYKLVLDWEGMTAEQRQALMVWSTYDSNSIRVRYEEDIPKELMPCIAEVSNTREGIRIKLHDKTAALDKLARFLKMYDEKPPGEKVEPIDSISITVKASKVL